MGSRKRNHSEISDSQRQDDHEESSRRIKVILIQIDR